MLDIKIYLNDKKKHLYLKLILSLLPILILIPCFFYDIQNTLIHTVIFLFNLLLIYVLHLSIFNQKNKNFILPYMTYLLTITYILIPITSHFYIYIFIIFIFIVFMKYYDKLNINYLFHPVNIVLIIVFIFSIMNSSLISDEMNNYLQYKHYLGFIDRFIDNSIGYLFFFNIIIFIISIVQFIINKQDRNLLLINIIGTLVLILWISVFDIFLLYNKLALNSICLLEIVIFYILFMLNDRYYLLNTHKINKYNMIIFSMNMILINIYVVMLMLFEIVNIYTIFSFVIIDYIILPIFINWTYLYIQKKELIV